MNIVRSVLEGPYEVDVLETDMRVPAGVREYVTSTASRPPKHHVFADYGAGPVVGYKKSLRSNLRRRDIRSSVSSNGSVFNMKSTNIARRIALNAIGMIVPYADRLEPTAIDGERASSCYSITRPYATAF